MAKFKLGRQRQAMLPNPPRPVAVISRVQRFATHCLYYTKDGKPMTEAAYEAEMAFERLLVCVAHYSVPAQIHAQGNSWGNMRDL